MTYLKQARRLIRDNYYPPEFTPRNWIDYSIANCYPYALDLKLNQAFLIGDFINQRVTKHNSDDKILSVLQKELKILGFEVTEVETDTICPDSSFKLFLGRDSAGDYHFTRQDADGIWSHKSSYFLPNRKDSIGDIIFDPDTSCSTYLVGWCFQLTPKEQF